MKLTKEQRFLYNRIAIIAATAGWLSFMYAGFQGFGYWYGGFIVCLWLSFGLVNLPHKSSVALLLRQPHLFFLLYAAAAATFYLGDRVGLQHFLWTYPQYDSWGFAWLYLVLYPVMGLALIELIYFVGSRLDAPFSFHSLPDSRNHRFVDAAESILFLIMMGLIVFAAAEPAPLPLLAAVTVVWIVSALVKLRLHIGHAGHFSAALLLAVVLATMLSEYPNLTAREWVYLPATALDPSLQAPLFGLPVWLWLGWFWLALVPLRLWIFLVLHPKVK